MEKLSYISKRYVVPFLAGATCLFYMPTARRVIVHENPDRLINPNKKDLERFYWKNSPRSSITSALGALTGAYMLADKMGNELLTLLLDKDPKDILTISGVFAATNFLSWCYEYPEMTKSK